MMMNAQNQYLHAQVQTASPGELTLMLYNGCLRFIKQGLDALKSKDISGKHHYFLKAQDIIEELQSTLDMQYDVSKSLYQLYEFIGEQLRKANVMLDEMAALESIKLVTELRDTWIEALSNLKRAKASI